MASWDVSTSLLAELTVEVDHIGSGAWFFGHRCSLDCGGLGCLGLLPQRWILTQTRLVIPTSGLSLCPKP